MTLTQIISQIVVNTFTGIIINLPWFLLIYWGFKLIAKELKVGIKNVPHYITEYFKLRERELKLRWAKNEVK